MCAFMHMCIVLMYIIDRLQYRDNRGDSGSVLIRGIYIMINFTMKSIIQELLPNHVVYRIYHDCYQFQNILCRLRFHRSFQLYLYKGYDTEFKLK